MSEWFPSGESGVLPQEKLLEITHKSHPVVVGIPMELDSEERRIALTPQAVSVIVSQGVVVLM